MVSRSAMGSDLFGELLEVIRVSARVDLTSEELAGRVDGDTRHFAAQAFLGMRPLEIDLLLRGGDDAPGFGARRTLGLVDDLVGAVLRMVDDLGSALARLAD